MSMIANLPLYMLCAVLLLYAGAACATVGTMVVYVLFSILCAALSFYVPWWAAAFWTTVTVSIIIHSVASGHWDRVMHEHGRLTDWLAKHVHVNRSG